MPKRIPLHRRKSDGRGVVTLDGRDTYTGQHGTADAQAKYDRLIAEYLANNRRVIPRHVITVAELFDQYQRSGEPWQGRTQRAAKIVLSLYADIKAAAFGPNALRTCRAKMFDEERDWTRNDVNQCTGRIVAVFRWGVSQELLGVDVPTALETVRGLRFGECREGRRVEPVGHREFEATLPFLSDPLAAAVQVQRLAGMRAGEVLAMMPGQIDRSGDVWIYRPVKHKTKHKGRTRTIHVGPRAQVILAPWLVRPADCYCFVPGESHWNGKNGRYSTSTYAQAIARACERAKVQPWTSHQLRHWCATQVREAVGIEAAQAVLDHATLDMTGHYAKVSANKAADAMRKVG